MAGFDCDYDTVIRKRPFQGNLYGDAVCCFSGYGVGADSYRIAVATNPKVINRRKYPRMPVANACTVTLKKSGKAYNGRMINISAGGFTFSVHQEAFANAIGQDISLEIPDFPLEEARTLDGHIIRSTDHDGEFIVGCRMPEDSEEIQAYVNKNYRE